MNKISKVVSLLAITLLSISNSSFAQTLQAESVANDIDNKNRSPYLTVSSIVGTNKITILADAFIPSHEFQQYPIQFDFFINRNFFKSQYRSPTRGGPIGIDVPNRIAKPPFDYVVVAKMLHPNSIYTTVLEGSVFTNNQRGEFDCTLTVESADSEEEAKIYTASSVSINQISTNIYSTSFNAKNEDETLAVAAQATIAEDEDDSTGTITIDNGKPISGSANIKSDDAAISEFNISSEDGETELSCSK